MKPDLFCRVAASSNKPLYAASYQRRRQQWGMNGGGPGSAIWKSTDPGQSWSKPLFVDLPASKNALVSMLPSTDPPMVLSKLNTVDRHYSEKFIFW